MPTDHRPLPTALIYFTVAIVMAVIASQWRPIDLWWWTVGLSVLLTGVAAVTLRAGDRSRRIALITAGCIFVAHVAMVVENFEMPADHRLASWLDEDRIYAEIEVAVIDGPIIHERGLSFDAQLLDVDIDIDDELTDPPPRIRVFYPTENISPCSRLPLPGDRVTTWARLERFAGQQVPWRTSHRRLMENRGYVAAVSVQEPLQFHASSDASTYLKVMRALAGQRIRLERRISHHVDGDALPFAIAMLTGSRGELSAELREPFDITSTGHILAISGLHFGVIAALIAMLIKLLLDRMPRLYRRCPRRILIGSMTLLILLFYLLTIGAPVSARRAFGMTALVILFVSFSPWRLSPLSALATTAGTLLMLRPSLLIEPGYQLSVAATAGIVLFLKYRPPSLHPPTVEGPEPEPRHRRWRRRVLIFVGLSLSATLATWPILLRMTGEVPIAGLWTNLIVVPLVSSVLFPLLVAGAILTPIWPLGADLLLGLSTQGLLLLRELLDLVAYAPGSVIRWGTPTTLEWVGAMIAVAIAIIGGLRPRALVAALLTALLMATPGFVEDTLAEPTTRLHFIYVGQGDATLIEFSDGTTVLIDAGGQPWGGDPGLRQVVPYLRHQGIRRLDAVVLTHGDYDHYGGIFATIRPFRPHRFYVDADEDNHRVLQLRAAMAQAETTIKPVDGRSVIATDDVDLHLHRPDLRGADPNDRSLVVSFSYAGAGVLLPGDIEAAGEAWLIDHVAGPTALLKIPHHGSNTSSSPAFIDHFSPAVAVASSGRHNRFGHPHKEVITRYEKRDIDLFRTDQQGAIVATIDDQGILTVQPTR